MPNREDERGALLTSRFSCFFHELGIKSRRLEPGLEFLCAIRRRKGLWIEKYEQTIPSVVEEKFGASGQDDDCRGIGMARGPRFGIAGGILGADCGVDCRAVRLQRHARYFMASSGGDRFGCLRGGFA